MKNDFENDQRRLLALCRTKFGAFAEKCFPVINPGQIFLPEWYVKAIVYQLERVHSGECKRSIICLPPRYLKSFLTSIAFPAFVLGRDPRTRIICASYAADFAKKLSNDFRILIQSNTYRSIFPNVQISDFKNTETEIAFTELGFRLATSVYGTLTGRGANYIIIDDPLKPDDALSEAVRKATNQWFLNSLLSRLDPKASGRIVIVMQRLHVDDLVGFVSHLSDEWEILSLPAIATQDESIPIGDGHFYHRQMGEVLSLQREPLELLESLRKQMGSAMFSAQYQQQPVPAEGAMIKPEWIQRYDRLPPDCDRLQIFQSWDTALKGGPGNDWSVCTTWILTKNKQWYLVDVWRKRVIYPDLKAAVIDQARKHKPTRVLIEDTGSGTALCQELKGLVPVVAVKVDRDKESRMSVVSAKFEIGSVHFPKNAPWLAELELELFSFPASKHDDQCDSISQALEDRNHSFFSLISAENMAAVAAKSRIPPRSGYGWGNR